MNTNQLTTRILWVGAAFALFVAWLLSSGCVTANLNRTPSLHEVIVKVKNDTDKKVEVAKDDDKIQRVMNIQSDDLKLSNNCRLIDDTAYLRMTSITSFDSETLWSDIKVLQSKKVKKLIIYMHNPGGSAFAGMGVVDELRLFKDGGAEIHMEGRAMIGSAAVPVFVAGGTRGHRIAANNTIFMLHPAGLWKGGFLVQREELRDLKSQAKMIELLNDSYAAAIAENSKLDKAEVLKMLECDNWFTCREAEEMGFVDECK